MRALSIINGVMDEKAHGDVERYALLQGFLSYEPDGAPDGAGRSSRIVLTCADLTGIEIYRDRISQLYRSGCPVILVPTADDEENSGSYRKCREYITAHAGFRFTLSEFREMLRRYVNRELLEERTLCFGTSFTIDRKQKTVIKQGRKIDLSPSEFNILLFLLDHAGTVVRREEMLNVLPHRKRGSTRNIDTHIKHIRRMLDMRDVIVCVRSVGYRLDEERFLGIICKAAE